MQNNRIRVIHTNDTIYTFAGNGNGGSSGNNGPATAAAMHQPVGVATDTAGNVYITDQVNNLIRKVNTGGIIITIAGTGFAGYSGDNLQATAAEINKPCQITADRHGNIFFADNNNFCIRKINTNGIITTVAGNGTTGYSGDYGQATAAKLGGPVGIAVDTFGNMYISDPVNYDIRFVNTSGIITTLAGTQTYGYTGDGGPAASAELGYIGQIMVDYSLNIYLTDPSFNRVREISGGIINTIAGSGGSGFSGDGGQATLAGMDAPYGLAMNPMGLMFISDQLDHHVRELIGLMGVNEVRANSEELIVYPNPSNGVFAISINNYQLAISNLVEVYTMLGQKVYSTNYQITTGEALMSSKGIIGNTNKSSNFQIDLSGQAPGVYLYHVISANGNLIYTGKLILEK